MQHWESEMDELRRQRQHIRSLMQYAVPEKDLEAALDLLVIFHDDRIALTILEEFYSYLPDAEEDWIKEVRLVARQHGVFLLAAVTSRDSYLYLVSSEGIEFHGSLLEGYLDKQLLDFFGFADSDNFRESGQNPENFPVYQPLQGDIDVCPACHAVTGEVHELGCPVEVCPWCGGQLIGCSCRFERLETDEMSGEQDLIRFEELLNQKGRIAYSSEQRPSFADDGPGIVQE
jgi:hypothetical protein